jgi:hypothetical protein
MLQRKDETSLIVIVKKNIEIGKSAGKPRIGETSTTITEM